MYKIMHTDIQRWGYGACLAASLLIGFANAPARADTFYIEIDWMATGGHSHRPSQDVIDTVVRMFACQGHTLIIDLDEQIPHHNVLRRDPSDCEASLFSYDGSADSFGALRDQYFDNIFDSRYHYCIFAHRYEDRECDTTGSSGLGQRPGRYFIVTLGGFSGQTGSEFDQAATLAHEFGHNLGLTHCGDTSDDCDSDGNYNPILASVMSYRYQLAGVRNNMLCNNLAPPQAIFRDIDYSEGRLCGLDETNLNERLGTFMNPVDWNCDNTLSTSIARDISNTRSGWCDGSGTLSGLIDRSEWARVESLATQIGSGALPEPVEEACITAEEWSVVQNEIIALGGCPQPTLTLESCDPGRNVFVGPTSILRIGYCALPYSPGEADANAPAGSTIFVKPGTYGTGPLTLDKPATWMCNTGVAIFE